MLSCELAFYGLQRRVNGKCRESRRSWWEVWLGYGKHLVKEPNSDTEIRGTGVRVYTVQGLRESGDTPEEIAEAYALPLAAVYEALAYTADHPEEMDAIDRADDAVRREILSGIPEERRRGIPPP
jgi:uncharacterized protein (DUF433 family)